MKRVSSLLYWVFALAYLICTDVSFTFGCVLKILPLAVLVAAILFQRRQICQKSAIALWMLIPALLFSMAGDVAGRFKTGANTDALFWQMGFFAVALVCYTIYFRHYPGHERINPAFILRIVIVVAVVVTLTSLAFGIFGNIRDNVQFIAGSAYLCTLFIMAYHAIIRWRLSGETVYAVGAIFFVISDGLIATGLLGIKVPAEGTLIMATYYLAQYLLNLPALPRL